MDFVESRIDAWLFTDAGRELAREPLGGVRACASWSPAPAAGSGRAFALGVRGARRRGRRGRPRRERRRPRPPDGRRGAIAVAPRRLRRSVRARRRRRGRAELGGIDVLVNNAAPLRRPAARRRSTSSTRASGTASWRSTSRARGCAPARALPAMREAGGGAIVNVASTTAINGSAGFAHYVASKGAVIALTRAHGARGRARSASGSTPSPPASRSPTPAASCSRARARSRDLRLDRGSLKRPRAAGGRRRRGAVARGRGRGLRDGPDDRRRRRADLRLRTGWLGGGDGDPWAAREGRTAAGEECAAALTRAPSDERQPQRTRTATRRPSGPPAAAPERRRGTPPRASELSPLPR